MFDYRKYIFRITLFLILIIFFIFFYLEELKKGFDHNQELNSSIILVFLLGVILVIRNLIILNNDQKWLIMSQREKNSKINISPKLITDFKSFYNSNQKVYISENKIKELIEKVAVRLDTDRELIKYIAALLVFLGLLGTFWGLLLTIDSVGETIGNLSIDEENILTNFMNLKEGLNAPLKGMGTAFSSSLFGLSGSLCLGFIDLQGNRAQNDFIESLEKNTLKYTELNNTENMESVGTEYIQALLHQTVEALNKLENILAKGEESRNSFENLIIESSKMISKILFISCE